MAGHVGGELPRRGSATPFPAVASIRLVRRVARRTGIRGDDRPLRSRRNLDAREYRAISCVPLASGRLSRTPGTLSLAVLPGVSVGLRTLPNLAVSYATRP